MVTAPVAQPPPPAPAAEPPPSPPPPAAPPPEAKTDDVLLVPARVAANPARPTVVQPTVDEIVVQRGDTLFSISQKHRVPLRDLVETNNLRAPYALAVGQRLRLPGAQYHTVVAGETLYSISRANSVDLNSLARENNIQAPYGLAVGQRLRLPAQMRPAAQPVATPAAVTPAAPTPAATTPTPPAAAPVPPPARQSSVPAGRLPAVAARSSTKFSWPVRGRILSTFGSKPNGLYNDGINIGAARGTAVRAAENGVIAYAGNELRGMGNLIIIQHSGGWMTVYAHLDTMTVRRGARVAVGEKIGTVGSTGRVTEPQLHFEIRQGTRAFNPTAHLR